MQVIIDYNNIRAAVRKRGLKYIAEEIALRLGESAVGKYGRLHLRLYDGWFSSQNPTQSAQTTSAEVQRDFPTVVTVPSTNGKVVRAVVAAELAYSLHCDPNNHIWHTFRQRVGQANVTCKSPVSSGCRSKTCALASIPTFFSNKQCPEAGCLVTPENLLVRNEQKLVDSMMATDLMSFHLSSQEELVIVSSDDDLWPVIRLLLHRGHTIYHIHTIQNRFTPVFYSQRVPANNYIQLHL